jgi:hypothetical protein
MLEMTSLGMLLKTEQGADFWILSFSPLNRGRVRQAGKVGGVLNFRIGDPILSFPNQCYVLYVFYVLYIYMLYKYLLLRECVT